MKGVTDIFISKQKLAIFWFLVALACIIGTAWHLYSVALEGRSRMLYVPVMTSDVYIDEHLSKQDLSDIVDYQTRLILETFFNRGPNGPVTPERLPFLFTPAGREQAEVDIRSNSYDFAKRQVHQMLELGKVNILQSSDGGASTEATGQLIRVSEDPVSKQTMVQSFTFRALMNLERNLNQRDAGRFLFICADLQYKLSEFSSSASN